MKIKNKVTKEQTEITAKQLKDIKLFLELAAQRVELNIETHGLPQPVTFQPFQVFLFFEPQLQPEEEKFIDDFVRSNALIARYGDNPKRFQEYTLTHNVEPMIKLIDKTLKNAKKNSVWS